MKKYKSLLLAVIGLLCSISVSAHGFEVDGIYYNITSAEDKTVEVTFSGDSYDAVEEYSGSVTIPETVTYNDNTYSVTSIGEAAFDGCYSLTSVEIPNSVTSIGDWAFSLCSGLTSVEIPNSVTSIGYAAFGCCSSLTSIAVAEDNQTYDSRNNCNAIIETQTNTLIAGCSETTIPNSVTSIGDHAFDGRSGLTSVEIPNSVTSIGHCAFQFCSGLTSVEIPNSVTSIGACAFRFCYGLTSVEIPNSVTSIGESAFEGCSNLRVVLNNSNLTFTKGNSSYGYIAYHAYVVCNGYEQVDDFIFTEEDDANYLRAYIGNATELVLPTNYKGGNYGIGDYAFANCSDLTSVEIPNSVTSIGSSAFAECSGLTSIVVAEDNSRYDSRDNCNAIIETQTNTLIAGCSETTIPNSVTGIGDLAFAECSGLTSVVIPNSVTSIGSSAFAECSGLTSVVIPNSVTSIGSSAFFGCSSLTSVVIPESVTSIGYGAFYDCSGLTSVVIPNSVTSIGDCAFYSCSSLASVEIPNSVTSIGDWAFYRCSSLTSVVIGNSVTSIGMEAFFDCSSLTSVVIPNSVTSIGHAAFVFCYSLTSVEIPNSVTSIGNYAFDSCSGLTSVTSHIPANNLFPIESNVFKYVDKSNCTLNVPYGAKEKYESTAGWNEFTNIVELIEISTYYELTYIVDSLVYQTDSVFAGDSIKLPEPPTKEGYTFVGWEGLPDIMPDCDVEVKAKFDVNVYCVTYKVDSITYQTDSIVFAESIVPPVAPTKEGHTFVVWEGLPDVMPAKDIEVTAKFDVNVYRITYKVDSITYQTDSIVFAESIVPPVAPTKEGHTFVVWEGLPDVMPAKDIEVTAKFDVNVYRITYKVDSITYQTDSIAFSATIVPPTAPAKEGYLFDGWEGLPDVMPAKDVEVMAKYSLNPVQTDEQGVLYELNATGDAFEAKGTTDELVADIVLPATIYGVPVNGIAAEAFKNAEIQTIVIPATIQEVGDDAFVGCTELRWVDWQAKAQVRAECFDAPEVHGNMLLFCYGEEAPDYAGNVVVNGKAKEIVLMDARPYASPYDYEAENISFTKTFTKETMIGTGAGWEGIVVPFDVERIVFGDKVIAPFGATGKYSDIPCWLAQMKDENFVMTDAIKADKAYIMAVPNSEAYDDDYNVEGDVRFEATNAVVKATANSATASANEHALVGTYEPVEIDADVFALNDDGYWNEYEGLMAPGSVFVHGLRDVRPFEAYVRSTKALQMTCLKIGSVLPTHITSVQSGKTDAEAWYTLQGKRLNTKPVQTGFYLHGGKLEFVRQQ